MDAYFQQYIAPQNTTTVTQPTQKEQVKKERIKHERIKKEKTPKIKEKAQKTNAKPVEQQIQPQIKPKATEYKSTNYTQPETETYNYNNTSTSNEPSPETYAVNDDEVKAMYQQLVSPQNAVADNDTKGIASYNPADDDETGLRATLRRMRYNSMDPHHGELHQIKINASNKFEGK
jgi:hypothetical protein